MTVPTDFVDGQVVHGTDLNLIGTVVNGKVALGRSAVFHVNDYGADPTGVAFSDAAVAAAIAARGSGRGAVVFGAGIYKLANAYTFGPGQPVTGQGWGVTRINYTGSGTCITCTDTRAFTTFAALYNDTGGPSLGGGVVGPFTILGGSAGAGAVGVKVGDISADVNVQVGNFSGTGSIGVLFNNNVTWSERLHVKAETFNCKTGFKFTKTGSGFPSFDYATKMDLSVYAEANQDGVEFGNDLDLLGGKFNLVGNFITAATNSGTVLKIGTNTSLREARIDLSVETAGATGLGHTALAIGTGSYISGDGKIIFIAGNGINFQDGNAYGKVFFTGRIKAGADLGTMSYSQGQRTLGAVTGSLGGATAAGTFYLGQQGNYFSQQLSSGAHTVVLDATGVAGQWQQPATYELFIQQPASGSSALTWPASVKWPGGVAPVMSTTPSAVNWVSLVTIDHTTYFGFHRGVMS